MNRRKLLRYLRSHPQVLDRDPIKNAPYLDEKDIPQDDTEQKPRGKSRTRYAIMGAVAGALAMFVFMLSPVGNAVSELVYNIRGYWNEDKTSFNFSYHGNVGKEPNDNGTYEFTSFEELEEVFPDLQIVRNDDAVLEQIVISTDKMSTRISTEYSIDGMVALNAQTIYHTETATAGGIGISDEAVPVDLTFHHGEIPVHGAYENGFAYLTGFAENSEFTFVCDNMPLDTFTQFVEESYIK